MRYYIDGTNLEELLAQYERNLQAQYWQKRAENLTPGEGRYSLVSFVRVAFEQRRHCATIRQWMWQARFDLQNANS